MVIAGYGAMAIWRCESALGWIAPAVGQVAGVSTVATAHNSGTNIRTADLAFLSPYATSKLKRFGD